MQQGESRKLGTGGYTCAFWFGPIGLGYVIFTGLPWWTWVLVIGVDILATYWWWRGSLRSRQWPVLGGSLFVLGHQCQASLPTLETTRWSTEMVVAKSSSLTPCMRSLCSIVCTFAPRANAAVPDSVG